MKELLRVEGLRLSRAGRAVLRSRVADHGSRIQTPEGFLVIRNPSAAG